MSFSEKSAWAVVAALVIVYGWYATVLAGWVSGSEPVDRITYQPFLAVVTMPLVVLIVAFHAIMAALSPKTAGVHDERDRLFELRAQAWGGVSMGAGVFGILCLAMLGVAPFWLAHAALGTLLVAELVTQSGRILLYRAGA